MDNQRLNIILGADDKPLKSGLKDSIAIIDNYTKKIEGSNTSIGQTRKMLKELKRMNIEAFDDAQLQKYDSLMAQLTDSAGDYDAKIKSLSLDPFQKYAEGMSSAVTMGTGLANVITLIGGNDEKMQKVMQQTIALQAVANGLQEASIFFKERAMGITIKQKAVEFAAWVSTTTITNAATIAVKNFNNALKSNIIGLIAAALAALVYVIYDLIKAMNDNSKWIETLTDKYDKLDQKVKELNLTFSHRARMAKLDGKSQQEVNKIAIDGINEQEKALKRMIMADAEKLDYLEGSEKESLIKRIKDNEFALQQMKNEREYLTKEIDILNKKDIENYKTTTKELKQIAHSKRVDDVKAAVTHADILFEVNRNLQQRLNENIDNATEERLAKAKQEAERLTILKNDIYGKIIAKYDVEVIIETEEESEAVRWAQKEKQRIEDQLYEMNGMLESGVEDMISTFAEGLGQLASGEIGFEEFGNMILGQVGSFAKMFGQALIGYGVAMEAFKKTFSNPFAAIATGAALVALGAVLGGLAKQAPSPKGGGGGGASSGGSQNMNMGWDKIRATTNQEAIHVNVGGEFRVQGASLVATVKNEDNRVNNW